MDDWVLTGSRCVGRQVSRYDKPEDTEGFIGLFILLYCDKSIDSSKASSLHNAI
jgi:hypothetical protein